MTELQMFGMLNLLPAIIGQQTVRTTARNTAAYQSFDEALRTAVKNDIREPMPTAATESKHGKEAIRNSEQSDLLFWSMLAGSYQRQMFWRSLMNPTIWQ